MTPTESARERLWTAALDALLSDHPEALNEANRFRPAFDALVDEVEAAAKSSAKADVMNELRWNMERGR